MNQLPQESAELFDIEISPEQLAGLKRFADLLVDWNARINLTAIRDPAEIRIKHFLDSLSCLTVTPGPVGRVIDVGTGAGFPGLVLKIMRPEIRLSLVESVAKKASFCRLVVDELALEGVDVFTERAETLGQAPEHREAYDWAVARALAPMPVLAEFLLPLVKVGGRMLAQKGAGGLEEMRAAENAFRILGGELESQRNVRLPGGIDDHLLVVYRKTRPTPAEYPRRVGAPGKRPL